jgi:hypothetical protein
MNPYISWTRRDTAVVIEWIAIMVTLLYVGVFIAFCIIVLLRCDFKYGLYRPELRPGPFLDDRYTYPWWFLIIGNIRLICIPAFLLVFSGTGPRLKAQIVKFMFQLLVVLDIFLLVAWVVLGCFFCNNGTFRNGVCDATRVEYCKVFWLNQTDLCPPSILPPAPIGTLDKRETYYNLIRFLLGFLGLDIFCILFLSLIVFLYAPINGYLTPTIGSYNSSDYDSTPDYIPDTSPNRTQDNNPGRPEDTEVTRNVDPEETNNANVAEKSRPPDSYRYSNQKQPLTTQQFLNEFTST